MNWKHCYHAFIFYGPWAALKPKIYNSNSQKSIFSYLEANVFLTEVYLILSSKNA